MGASPDPDQVDEFGYDPTLPPEARVASMSDELFLDHVEILRQDGPSPWHEMIVPIVNQEIHRRRAGSSRGLRDFDQRLWEQIRQLEEIE